jgi:WD40 repeat protein
MNTFNTHSCVNDICVAPNGAVIASGHLNSEIQLWSIATGECICTLKDMHIQQVTSVEFNPVDGMKILTNSCDNTLNYIDIRTMKSICTYAGKRMEQLFDMIAII